MKLIAFCEAPADHRLAAGLVDRVRHASGIAWVVDALETPALIRTWQPDGFGRPYFDVHNLNQYADKLGVKTRRGHFNGQPGRPGSAMARKAFQIAWALHKRQPDEPIKDDLDREARCWREPPLETLRGRGAATGLAAFLDELEAVLARLLGAPSRPSAS